MRISDIDFLLNGTKSLLVTNINGKSFSALRGRGYTPLPLAVVSPPPPSENPGSTPAAVVVKVCFILLQKERFSQIRLEKVGPGSYTPRVPVDHEDFNRADTTKNFHSPIATGKSDTEKGPPAPNTYNVNRIHTEKNSAITGEAAFKSKLVAYTVEPMVLD